LSKILVM